MKLVLKTLVMLLMILVWTQMTQAQKIGDGLPEEAGTKTPVNIVYTNTIGQVVSEKFDAPDIIRDFGDVGYLNVSAIDSNRVLDSLPNFGLALFHWWLFGFEVLPHAQKDYAKCVGEIRAYQKTLKVQLLVDDPGAPTYEIVNMITHYLVPFQAMERFDDDKTRPPGLEEAKAHARAALDSINLTVFHTGLCRISADYLKGLVDTKIDDLNRQVTTLAASNTQLAKQLAAALRRRR